MFGRRYYVSIAVALVATLTYFTVDLYRMRYVAVIDAGSTGSRLTLYGFHGSVGGDLKLVSEHFESTQPGLSSYESEPTEAALSLKPLLDGTLQRWQVQLVTMLWPIPLTVKATAGLRLLDANHALDILSECERFIRAEYSRVFALDSVGILEGKLEGVGTWLTVNYLLGRLSNIESVKKPPTVAVMDLGGASTQIVFDPGLAISDPVVPGDHSYDLQFGDHHYNLYQHSHLGYGLMEARNRIHTTVVESAVGKTFLTNRLRVNPNDTIYSPCLPKGVETIVPIRASWRSTLDVTMVGSGSPEECLNLTLAMLNRNRECNACGFNGVYQPCLQDTFGDDDIYIASYFYDRLTPLGVPPRFSLREMKPLISSICEQWTDDMALQYDPQWCLDTAFIYSILHCGYGITLDRPLNVAQVIDGHRISWALGVALQVLNYTVEVK